MTLIGSVYLCKHEENSLVESRVHPISSRPPTVSFTSTYSRQTAMQGPPTKVKKSANIINNHRPGKSPCREPNEIYPYVYLPSEPEVEHADRFAIPVIVAINVGILSILECDENLDKTAKTGIKVSVKNAKRSAWCTCERENNN